MCLKVLEKFTDGGACVLVYGISAFDITGVVVLTSVKCIIDEPRERRHFLSSEASEFIHCVIAYLIAEFFAIEEISPCISEVHQELLSANRMYCLVAGNKFRLEITTRGSMEELPETVHVAPNA